MSGGYRHFSKVEREAKTRALPDWPRNRKDDVESEEVKWHASTSRDIACWLDHSSVVCQGLINGRACPTASQLTGRSEASSLKLESRP